MAGLKIARGFELPIEAVTQTFAILAKRGAGKSYTASVMVEEMLERGQNPVVIDPLGVWWGLQSSDDGKKEGYSITVLGGDHGDVPLEPTAGATIADFVVNEKQPVVVDLSHFKKSDQIRFTTAFLETLYQKNRDPLHVVVDEADLFAPQRAPRGHEARCLGAMEDLSRRGRARGIGMTLVTQRSAVLNKNVLTQIEVLVVMRTTSPQDRKAIKAWVDVHGEEETWQKMDAELPKLPVGHAYVWSPGWLDDFTTVQVRKRRTFDSSATPKVGETRIEPQRRAQPDLDALREQIAETIEAAKKNDPTELRREIAKLESELQAERNKPQPQPEVRTVFPELLKDQVRSLLKEVADNARRTLESAERLAGEVDDDYEVELEEVERQFGTVPKPQPPKLPPPASPTTPAQPSSYGRAERAILSVLLQFPQGRTKTQIAVLTGYSSKGGGFNNALSRLRTDGLIMRGEPIRIGDETRARDAVGDSIEEVPVVGGWELLEFWLPKLEKAPRLILEALYNHESMTKDELAEATGYAPSGGGFNNALSRLRTLELIGRGDPIEINEAFRRG